MFIYRAFDAENGGNGQRRFLAAGREPAASCARESALPAAPASESAAHLGYLCAPPDLVPTGLARLEALEQQRKGLQLEVQRLEREIERLRIQAESVKTSPASIERVARDELGLVRQTELVMQFKKD